PPTTAGGDGPSGTNAVPATSAGIAHLRTRRLSRDGPPRGGAVDRDRRSPTALRSAGGRSGHCEAIVLRRVCGSTPAKRMREHSPSPVPRPPSPLFPAASLTHSAPSSP